MTTKRSLKNELIRYDDWRNTHQPDQHNGARIRVPAKGFPQISSYDVFFNAIRTVGPHGPDLCDALINDLLNPYPSQRMNSIEASAWAQRYTISEPLELSANRVVAETTRGGGRHADVRAHVAQVAAAIREGTLTIPATSLTTTPQRL